MGSGSHPRARVDMHVHTCYSGWRRLRLIHPKDCYSTPLKVYRAALERGMAFVAITDHDTIEGALRLRDTRGVDPAKVIIGEEVECTFPETGQWLHLNVYGLSEEDHAALAGLKRDVRDVMAYCKERGLLHVLNHPFQSYLFQQKTSDYLYEITSLFSHLEGFNGGIPPRQNRSVGRLCDFAMSGGLQIIQVGGSDAHTVRRVGSAYTEASAATAEEFLEEVSSGRCTVGGRNVGTPGLMMDVYQIIGAYYLRLFSGRGEARTKKAYAVDILGASALMPAVVAGLPAAITVCSQLRQNFISSTMLRSLRKLQGYEACEVEVGDSDYSQALMECAGGEI